jgi:hypothetical protein
VCPVDPVESHYWNNCPAQMVKAWEDGMVAAIKVIFRGNGIVLVRSTVIDLDLDAPWVARVNAALGRGAVRLIGANVDPTKDPAWLAALEN